MADDTDELPASPAAEADPRSVGWPLVERRRRDGTPPGGIDRRGDRTPASSPVAPTLTAAPLWPFRLAALAGAIVRATDDFSWHNWNLLIITFAATAYTLVTCLYPVAYRNDPKVRMRIVIELALNTAAVMLSGAWTSPFVLFFVPTGMLAGFAAGGLYSAQLAAAAVVVVTAQHVP